MVDKALYQVPLLMFGVRHRTAAEKTKGWLRLPAAFWVLLDLWGSAARRPQTLSVRCGEVEVASLLTTHLQHRDVTAYASSWFLTLAMNNR